MKKYIILALLVVAIFIAFLFVKNKTKDDSNTDSLVHINMEKYNEMIKDKKDFVLIISQLGCSHCEKFLPIARKVAKANKIQVYDLNVTNLSNEDKTTIANTYNVTGTPTTIFIKKGKEANKMDRLSGSVTEDKFETKLKDLGYIK